MIILAYSQQVKIEIIRMNVVVIMVETEKFLDLFDGGNLKEYYNYRQTLYKNFNVSLISKSVFLTKYLSSSKIIKNI